MTYCEPFINFKPVAKKCYIMENKDGSKFTKVTIQAPTGEKYVGQSFIKTEDTDYYRPLTGYKIAENRAYINYLKVRIKELRYHKNILFDILRKEDQKSSSVYSNREQRDMAHKVIELSKEIKDIKNKILDRYKLIDSIIDERWKIIDKIEARAEKNQKRQEIVDAIRAGQNS